MGLYNDVIFPRFYDLFVRHKAFDEKRAGTLSKARGRILEIGVGTGLNLDQYPGSVNKITAIEPNPGMKKEFLRKADNHRLQVDFKLVGAEKMPFDNEEFDTVISTITLCSIPHLQEALTEIFRVLKPNGQFLFLDHGLSCEKAVAKYQKILNPFWKVFGAGCQLTIDIEKEIKFAGFKIQSLEKYHIEKAPKFIGSVYEGVALKQSIL